MWNRKSLQIENTGSLYKLSSLSLSPLLVMAEREINGPTQVHPALNYNDLTQHIHGLNGLNGISNGLNGIITNPKPFGERGELSSDCKCFKLSSGPYSYPK
jgi:hypothetical protein